MTLPTIAGTVHGGALERVRLDRASEVMVAGSSSTAPQRAARRALGRPVWIEVISASRPSRHSL